VKKKLVVNCNTFFWRYRINFSTKFKIILFLKYWRNKFGPIFKELKNFLPQKIVTKLSMGLGSEIWDPEKTYSGSRIQDPGVKKAPDPGSATLFEGTF
jgi:hypothetical protein